MRERDADAVGDAGALAQDARGAEAAIAQDEVEVGVAGGEDGVEVGAHGPAACEMTAARFEPVAHGIDAAIHGKVERCGAEHVDAQGLAFLLAELVELFFAEPFGLWKVPGGSRFRQCLAGQFG